MTTDESLSCLLPSYQYGYKDECLIHPLFDLGMCCLTHALSDTYHSLYGYNDECLIHPLIIPMNHLFGVGIWCLNSSTVYAHLRGA